jgi:hypothetical protein
MALTKSWTYSPIKTKLSIRPPLSVVEVSSQISNLLMWTSTARLSLISTQKSECQSTKNIISPIITPRSTHRSWKERLSTSPMEVFRKCQTCNFLVPLATNTAWLSSLVGLMKSYQPTKSSKNYIQAHPSNLTSS